MTLNNLLVEMRAEFEKKFPEPDHGFPFTADPEDLLSFIETQMKRVSEETYKAVSEKCECDLTEQSCHAGDELESYKTFTHQP